MYFMYNNKNKSLVFIYNTNKLVVGKTHYTIHPMSFKILTIKHPSTTLGPAQLQNLRTSQSSTNVAIKTGFDILSREVNLNYKSRVIPYIDIGPHGAGLGHDEFIGDSMQIYHLALMYLATNDICYKKKALELQDEWNTKCKSFKGSNAPLECAWGGINMIRSVELLKHYKPSQIVSWDITFETRFKSFLEKVIVPNLLARYNEVAKWNNNWILTIQEALLQYYLYTDNIVDANKIINDFINTLPKCVPYNCGMCTETKRDLIHSQFQIGSIVQFAEMCYHQGINMYNIHNNLISKCMEYHAMLLNGKLPEGSSIKKEELKDMWFMPSAWDIGHNHFTYRQLPPMKMQETTTLLNTKKNRPEKLSFNWGPAWIHHKTN